MSNNKICIFHSSCADGFGAALAVYHSKEWGTNTEFVAAHYGDKPPNVVGKDVIIVDFSYPRETLLAMNEQANSLLVIDHHKTAQEHCEGLEFCLFDMSHSGAWLAWNHLIGDIPDLVLYIEDRDLWKWELQGSKEYSAALQSYPMDFKVWTELAFNDLSDVQLINEGVAIMRYQRQQVARAVERWIENPQFITLTLESGETISAPTLNTTTLISEIGNELSKGYPCSATYFIRSDGKKVYSLRSQEDGLDVSKVAKHYGGGGHNNAAGFVL